MNIALDAHYIGTNCGGVETYVYNLIESVLKIDTNNKYCLYLSPFLKKGRLPSFVNNNTSIKYLLSNKGISRIFIDIPFKLFKYRPDIYHGQIFLPILSSPAKYLLTVHDTLFLENKWLTIKEKIKFKHIPYSIKKSNHIITVSNVSKTELLKNFNISENKISTVYCGINDSFYQYPKNISDMDSIKIKYALPENYILYVGRFNIRKNLINLIKAFSLLKQKNKNPIKLVLVGKFDGKCEDIHKLIKELDIKKEVVFLDYINNSELPYIYSLSTLFAFPSFYEGFGLPPLEAMASRVPVVASNIPVFQEILGDAAILVNPHNPSEIFSVMNKILNEKKIRLELIEKGAERAENFRWQKAASKTIEIYNKL